MALDPRALPAAVREFLAERHLATLTTLRPDGTPHVVPIGFTWDDEAGLARVITGRTSRKARHLDGGGRVALCQVDGGRWLTLEGDAVVTDDPARVAEAVRRYADRYRQPRPNPDRVAVEVSVDRVLGLVQRAGGLPS
ncbi:MAG TPA: PPOX class F420-dependent oxidoreductase [Mycobacteriales bacterium]|jgi:PPOX class probable F420-dependent enzyme